MTPAEAPPPLVDLTAALAFEGVEPCFGCTLALEDVAVAMRHLARAARSEFAKIEKPLSESELKGWR